MNLLSSNWSKIAVATTLFSALAYCMVFLPQDTFLQLAKEDGLLEWAATLLFLITAILFFVLFFNKKCWSVPSTIIKVDKTIYYLIGEQGWLTMKKVRIIVF